MKQTSATLQLIADRNLEIEPGLVLPPCLPWESCAYGAQNGVPSGGHRNIDAAVNGHRGRGDRGGASTGVPGGRNEDVGNPVAAHHPENRAAIARRRSLMLFLSGGFDHDPRVVRRPLRSHAARADSLGENPAPPS
jgi:hypothetical protein